MAYTNIDDPSAHFQTALYTGTGSANNAITNDGNSDLQPDWIWFKSRDAGNSHYVVDSSRGRDKGLYPDVINAEVTSSGSTTDCQSFDTDGFTVGTPEDANSTNSSSSTKVAWQWKANGGTTSSNTDGDITSTVQVNSDAGFSIVTYTGNGSTADQTVGHGLGVRANAVLVKNRDSAANWVVYVDGLVVNHSLTLNTANGQSDSTQGRVLSSSAGSYGTTSIFTLRSGSGSVIQTNTSGADYVAYCFAEKQGYSKFGKYVGNGNADGTFVYTGFKPAWVMTKEIGAAGAWVMYDNKRSTTSNPQDKYFSANTEDAEATFTQYDFVSNGFKFRTSGSENSSGNTHIYMAFAENPFTTSTGVPCTAR